MIFFTSLFCGKYVSSRFYFVQMCEIHQRYTGSKKRERNKIKSKEKERKENSSESVDAGRLKSKDRNLK